jgi:adhesin/invasin
MLSESLAPGSLVTLFGVGLASDSAAAAQLPLPTALANTTAIISGVRAPLLFVGPGQINAQVPYESLEGRSQIVIRNEFGESAPARINVSAAAPEFFISGDNDVIAVNADGAINSAARPAPASSKVSLFLSGLGLTTPVVATGAAAPFEPLAWARGPVTVEIGGRPSEVLFAGLTPGFVGLAQIDLVVPVGLSGRLPIRVTVSGTPSTSAFLHVQ